ncbi:MAG: adenylyltransferase/cytidyltransferase family protein [Verrucomicrobia bacterium]|nr:adenylyltransferase/cytidyltransferase family protein [Verrucomicrobiota bacterium]
MKTVVVPGVFDDIRSGHVRFLEEAAKLGAVTVLLRSDAAVQERLGRPPKLPQAERHYVLGAIRHVHRVRVVHGHWPEDTLPDVAGFRPDAWVVGPCRANAAQAAHAQARGIAYHVIAPPAGPRVFPAPPPVLAESGRKKVVVTGCYDWFHSGHVRFFEEVHAHGDVYVVVGHDANIRLLKGEGHPLFPQDERRYLVGSVRFVKHALISSGHGWLDAEPEIRRLRPDIYAVNEDGDRGGKREFCERHGIQYLVLRRTPAPGLPSRSSTELRGY